MRCETTLTPWLFATATLVAAGLWSHAADAVVVDCDAGGSIQDQIEAGETQIEFSGTCDETVFVSQDGTNITGTADDRASNRITGGVQIISARARLTHLTITGESVTPTPSGVGALVAVVEDAYARFFDVAFERLHNGVVVSRGSTGIFNRASLAASSVDDADFSCNPICVIANSYAQFLGSTVTGGTDDPAIGAALSVARGSVVELRGGNVVTNTGAMPAVRVFSNASLHQDNGFRAGTDTIDGGATADLSSLIDIDQAVIDGPVRITRASDMLLGNPDFGADPSAIVVNGDVTIAFASHLFVAADAVTINGDVECLDMESSLDGGFRGGRRVDCTGFDVGRRGGP